MYTCICHQKNSPPPPRAGLQVLTQNCSQAIWRVGSLRTKIKWTFLCIIWVILEHACPS